MQQENAEQVRLASSASEEQASIEVLVDNQLKAIVELICQIADWEGVRIQIDPWFKHGLPPTGNIPYQRVQSQKMAQVAHLSALG